MPGWFDDFAAAIDAGEAHYLACEACGEATLPPREICPDCGGTDLTETPLPERGEVLSFTEISVTIPKFQGETPYTCVLAEVADGLSLTGQLRGGTAEAVAIGDEVVVGVESRESGTPVVTFRPAA